MNKVVFDNIESILNAEIDRMKLRADVISKSNDLQSVLSVRLSELREMIKKPKSEDLRHMDTKCFDELGKVYSVLDGIKEQLNDIAKKRVDKDDLDILGLAIQYEKSL